MGRIVSEHAELSEDDLVTELVKLGHPENSARRAYIFVPISFGNDVLKKLAINFPEDEYQFLSVQGKDTQKRSLKSEPSFVAAEAIQDEFKKMLGMDIFLRIANVSASMSTVNNALAAGKTVDEISGATMSAPVVWGID